MSWSSESSATQLTGVTDTEQFFDVTPQLNPGEMARVQVEANPPASPTDALVVNVYGTLDGTNWDDEPILRREIPNDKDPNQVSFPIIGVYQFRVGVKSSGTTDSFTADMSYRTDGVSL